MCSRQLAKIVEHQTSNLEHHKAIREIKGIGLNPNFKHQTSNIELQTSNLKPPTINPQITNFTV
jgi:hypothetical protein